MIVGLGLLSRSAGPCVGQGMAGGSRTKGVNVRGLWAGLFLLLPGTAMAAPVADLTLNLAGAISQVCTIRQTSQVNVIELRDAPGAYDVDYRVNCNSPLSVSMTSQNGGLEHDQYRNWPNSPGFTGMIRYDAQFKVDFPGAAPVVARSDRMKQVYTGETGVIPFEADARLHLSWTPEGRLLGGRYQDTITIHVFGSGS